jgi:hypothetical protein
VEPAGDESAATVEPLGAEDADAIAGVTVEADEVLDRE